MKKVGIAVIALLWLLAGVQVVRSFEYGGEDRIHQVLGKVGTMDQTCVVEYYGVLEEGEEDGKAFLRNIAQSLEVEGGTLYISTEENGNQTLSLKKQDSQLKLELKLVTDLSRGQHVLADVILWEDAETAFNIRKKLDKEIKEYVKAQRSSVNVIGSVKGNLTLEERNKVADELLCEMDARVVAENRDLELYTIYGYTPYIAEYQLQEGNAVNVNIAMNYDEEKNRTYIYAAVPVIGLDY